MTLPRISLIIALAAFAGCTKPDAPKPETPKTPDTNAPTTPPAVAASSPECVGPVTSTPEETFEIAGKKFVRKGSTISMEGADADDELIIGHITDIKDHTPDNAANLKVILEWMKGQKVDVIAVTGDLGESQESI